MEIISPFTLHPSPFTLHPSPFMPLTRGYSAATVKRNIAEMIRDSYSRESAVAASYAYARASFFKAHPQGALPAWLAFPATCRLRQYYTATGVPVNRRIARKTNPAPRQELKQAARRFAAFTGNTDVSYEKIRVNSHPKVLLAIGPADGILYSTVRDGYAEKYVHHFKKRSRPLLASSPDGKRLYLLGGAYTFTNRGITDR